MEQFSKMIMVLAFGLLVVAVVIGASSYKAKSNAPCIVHHIDNSYCNE